MTGYDLLAGVRVIELAQLSPSSVGGHLADMGAEVIHIEPIDGDVTRYAGGHVVGSDDIGFLHLRWNRGKKSLALNLKHREGKDLFRNLVRHSDVVIEGFRPGMLGRLGLGYDVCREVRPEIVFASVSGYGRSGPYRDFGSHGPGFDAYGGLLNPVFDDEGNPHLPEWVPVGMHATGLFGAFGIAAAIVKAARSGVGTFIEVAAADVSAAWLPERVDPALNDGIARENGTYLPDGKLSMWSRLTYYRSRDDKILFFQPYESRFWENFCRSVGRDDLVTKYPEPADDLTGEATVKLWAELVTLFRERTYDEWMELFAEADVPTGPVNSVTTLLSDPHFTVRDNVYDVEVPGAGQVRLTATPVKVDGQDFSPRLAPGHGQHTDEVLVATLGLDEDEVGRLRAEGVVGGR